MIRIKSACVKRMIRSIGLLTAAGLSLALAAPRALAPAEPGLWAIGRSATGVGAQPVCLADLALLAQWEHRGARCSRVVISDTDSKLVIDYTCRDGGFGRSELTLVTPRSLRVATQGISRDGPFNYTIHARRVGNCVAR